MLYYQWCLQVLASIVFLRLHPMPLRHTPSYEFTTSFGGVCWGIVIGVSRQYRVYLQNQPGRFAQIIQTRAGMLALLQRIALGTCAEHISCNFHCTIFLHLCVLFVLAKEGMHAELAVSSLGLRGYSIRNYSKLAMSGHSIQGQSQCKDNAIGNQALHSGCSGTSEQGQCDVRTLFLVTNATNISRDDRNN